jgi:drug/metabolite transporter (DMT)-like permease
VRQERGARGGDNPVAGILCLTAGLAIFTLQDVILKLMSDTYPVHQAVAIRAAVALPILALFVALDGGLGQLASRRARALALRGAVMCLAYLSYYLGLAGLPLATCLALFFVAPIMVTVLAGVVLGERVGTRAGWRSSRPSRAS